LKASCQNNLTEKTQIIVESFDNNKPETIKPGESIKFLSETTDYSLKNNFYLVINDLHLTEVRSINPEKTNELIFTLPEMLEDDEFSEFYKLLNPSNLRFININIGIASDSAEVVYSENEFQLVYDTHKSARTIIGIIILMFILWITIKTINKKSKLGNMLKDSSNIKDKPYSLSRTQLAFWTLILLISIVYIWMRTSELIEITDTVLVLLGISLGTNIAGRLIDNSDIINPQIKKRHQNENSGKSFFINICSDRSGLSIHRFQNVAFSLIIGIYFLFEVFTLNTIPDLNTNLLILMGISSGGYLTIKTGENKFKTTKEKSK